MPQGPSSLAPVAELLGDLGRTFAALGIRWYLFGAQAAIVHGVARLTADVDVTVALGSRSTTDLITALARAGFESRVQEIDAFVETTRVLPVVHGRSRIPVDIVLAGPGLEDLFFARAEERMVGGVRVPVAAAEDVVAMKLLAGRPKDLDDVAAIIRARGPKLGVDTIRETLALVERALDRRDLTGTFERLLGARRA